MYKEVADSRSGSGIRVFLKLGEAQDFFNEGNVFLTARVNDQVWTGPTVIEEERYLDIHQWRTKENGELSGRIIANFPAGTWLGVRTIAKM